MKPQRRPNGCGHAALLTQSLDNRFAVTHMPTPQRYDGRGSLFSRNTHTPKRRTISVNPAIPLNHVQGVIFDEATPCRRVRFFAEVICPVVSSSLNTWILQALAHGSGYERIASPGCSDRTIRRRIQAWAARGLTQQLHTLALAAYERMIGLNLDELAVDGCITKAPSGGGGSRPRTRGHERHHVRLASLDHRQRFAIDCKTRYHGL